MATFPSTIPICDPHFHLWITPQTPNPNLGAIVDAAHPVEGAAAPPLGHYPGERFLADVGALPLAACLHVETVVGQTEGGFELDTVKETAFVCAEAARCLAPRGVKFGVVAFVQLGRDDAPEVLARHEAAAAAGGSALRGVRMILNYSATEPSQCWPQVGPIKYLAGESLAFSRNFAALLAPRGLVFDLHVNWHQLEQAADFIAATAPETVVVLDHLGCVKLGAGAEEDARRLAAWEAGMVRLAANPRAHCKISGLEYIAPGWTEAGSAQRAVAESVVAHALAVFGSRRCMVASNFPVDLHDGQKGLPELYAALHEVLAAGGRPHDELVALFHGNAMRVYGL